jgi:hypothetical protein
MVFIFVAVIGTYLLSTLVGFIFFRNIAKPRKYYYSIPITWVVSTFLAGYGFVDGEESKFLNSAVSYGIASIILLSIYIVPDFLKKRKKIRR